MSREMLTVPIDPVIEMPHPLLVYGERLDEAWNYDHMFFPERPLRWGSYGIGGKAVRKCYGQAVPIRIHTLKNQYFDSVDLPTTDHQQFETVVKGFAGVVSRQAIDMRLVAAGADDPLVYMDDDTFVRTTETYGVYHQDARSRLGDRSTRRTIGRFMMDYALRSNLHILMSDSAIDEFLFTPDRLRRKLLGGQLIHRALQARLDPIAPEVTRYKHLGLVQNGSPHVRELPEKIIPYEKLVDYHDALADLLVAA